MTEQAAESGDQSKNEEAPKKASFASIIGTLIGKAIKKLNLPRDEIVVMTKVHRFAGISSQSGKHQRGH